MWDTALQATQIMLPKFPLNGPTSKSTTVASPQIGHPHIGQILKVTGKCGDGRVAIACGPDIGQLLKAWIRRMSDLRTVRCIIVFSHPLYLILQIRDPFFS
jgi:hypothetical protein